VANKLYFLSKRGLYEFSRGLTALKGFLMTKPRMTSKDVGLCGYIMLENFSLVIQHLRFCGVQCSARSVSQPR